MKSRSREIGCCNGRIALKLTGTSATALPRYLPNFKAIGKVYTLISRLRDLTRSCGKTSYRLVNRGPGSGNPCGWGKFNYPANVLTKSRVKINGKSHHGWPKFVIHSNEYIILPLTLYLSWTENFAAKSNHRSLISPLSPRNIFSDLALWRHHSWSVTSRERELLALWRHIRRLFLHAQNGTKAIVTNEVHLW